MNVKEDLGSEEYLYDLIKSSYCSYVYVNQRGDAVCTASSNYWRIRSALDTPAFKAARNAVGNRIRNAIRDEVDAL